MYVLEKLSVKEDAQSAVRVGYRLYGNKLFKHVAEKQKPKEIKRVTSIEVGKQVLLVGSWSEFLNTSPIEEILEQEDNWITFRTRTSVYKLTKVKDE